MHEGNVVQLLKMSALNKGLTLMAGNKPRGSAAHRRDSLSVSSAAVQTPAAERRDGSARPRSPREAFIAMELSLSETHDLNPITAAVCVCSL